MPRRKKAVLAERCAPPQSVRRKADNLLAQREQLVADIARMRARGDTSSFVENAQQLLTRWWGPATWSAREELLKSAGWLLRLAQAQHDPLPAPGHQGRSDTFTARLNQEENEIERDRSRAGPGTRAGDRASSAAQRRTAGTTGATPG